MIFPSVNLSEFIRQYRTRTRRSVLAIFRNWSFGFFDIVCAWGQSKEMAENEKKKLAIFNQLNLFQLIAGLGIFLACLGSHRFSVGTSIALLLPVLVSTTVLMLNRNFKHEHALNCYFLLYPIMTCNIYLRGMDFGFELNFILFGILSVFFLQQIGMMVFSIGLSMVSYFVLSVLWKDYSFYLEAVEPGIYIAIQLFTILLIFYGLYLIKKENAQFQFSVMAKNHVLENKNQQIQKKNKEIRYKAILLEEQTQKLQELHTVKNKLFSVIAHDLKAPIYALRNLFQYVNEHDLPADEIKTLVPDVVTDLNHTTDLMENLLHWAKTQMGGTTLRPALIEMTEISDKIVGLLRVQAQAKKIVIENKTPRNCYAYGDKDMISLVLRNLVSNAIKYTPVKGRVTVEVNESVSCLEVMVRDTGIGMTKEILNRVNASEFYTSKGTCEEPGTGLGLMLCREFINRNGGQLRIESEPGRGSIFSFTLPLPQDLAKAAG